MDNYDYDYDWLEIKKVIAITITNTPLKFVHSYDYDFDYDYFFLKSLFIMLISAFFCYNIRNVQYVMIVNVCFRLPGIFFSVKGEECLKVYFVHWSS